jgi:Hemopexin
MARHGRCGFRQRSRRGRNWGDGKAYFFKGNKYLRYDIAGDKVDAGWPKLIADEWGGMATAGFGAGLEAAIILVGFSICAD